MVCESIKQRWILVGKPSIKFVNLTVFPLFLYVLNSTYGQLQNCNLPRRYIAKEILSAQKL